jgi:hypothetical protein
MERSAFMDQFVEPTDERVKAALGRTATHWGTIVAKLSERYGPLAAAWKFSGKNYGWTLKLERGKRSFVYLTPCTGFLRASFALGDAAIQAAHGSGLPEEVLAEMDSAPKYPEGRPVRVEVRRAADVKTVLAVAAIKAAS